MRARNFLLLTAALCATRASAQLPSASTAALGMGENYTAVARGYNTIAWNPALLALHGNPHSSLTLVPLRVVTGLDPVSLSDLQEFQGRVLPDDVKAAWLSRVEGEGVEEGNGGADITYIAAQIGRFALQISSRALATADLQPGAVLGLLYGNAGRNNGQPEPFTFVDSRLDGFALSTVAASYAFPIKMTDGRVAIGATAKYSMGHFMVFARDAGSTVTNSPTATDLPTVSTVRPGDESNRFNNGTGFGLDVGVALEKGRMTLSGVVQNVVNTFEWRTDDLFFRPGSALFDSGAPATDVPDEPFSSAPEALQTAVKRLKYRPTVAVGWSLRANDRVSIAADMRTQLGDEGIQDVPDFHMGAGIEYKANSWLPLRAGGGLINEGYEIGAGVGAVLGPFDLGVSAMRRLSGVGTSTVMMVTLISTRR